MIQITQIVEDTKLAAFTTKIGDAVADIDGNELTVTAVEVKVIAAHPDTNVACHLVIVTAE